MAHLYTTITPRRRAILTGIAMLTVVMMTIDMSIAIVAMPKIQSGLAATTEQITWVLTSYMVAAAVGTPLVGALAERIGFRQVYIMGVVGFGLASVMCGLSTSLPQLVLFRALQGFTGAVFQPLGQALLYEMNPPHRLGKAMSWFSIGIMVGPTIGPVVGGLIADSASWRWLFLINGPLIVIALIGVLVYMPKLPRDRTRPFDFFGFGLLVMAVACTQLALDRGELLDWLESREILLEIGLAVMCGYMYIVHAVTTRHPFVNPIILRDRNVVAGLIGTFFIAVLVFVPMSFLTLFVQNIQGYDVLDAGLIQTPRAVAMAGACWLIGNISHRIPLRWAMLIGAALGIVGSHELTGLSVDSSAWFVIWTGGILAIGMMLIMMPLNLVTFATLDSEHRPMGMALFALTRQLGSSVGIAIMASYLSRSTNENLVRLVSELNPFNDAIALGGAGTWAIRDPTSLKLLTLEVYRQANAIGYDNMFSMLTWMAVAIMPLVLLLRLPRRGYAPKQVEPAAITLAT